MSVSSALAVVLALAMTYGVGWSLTLFCAGGLCRAERWAWSFAAGLLAQSILLLAAAATGLPPRRGFFLAADLAVVAVCAWLARGRRRPEIAAPSGRTGPLVPLLLTAAGAAWLLFLLLAVSEPMWATDYLAIWGLKGKTIHETGTLPSRLFRDTSLYWAHREYPLLAPLTLAALAGIAGEWNDQALALLFPAVSLATLALLYGFLSRRVSRTAGAVATCLGAFCFRLYNPVNAGTAEVPFALGAVLAACALLDVLEANSSQARLRLVLAALFCASAKQEGTLWIALLGVVFLAARGLRGWKREEWMAAGSLALPVSFHWVLLFLLRGPQTRRDFDFHFFEPGQWANLLSRFAAVCARVATTEMREAALPLAAILLYLLVTRRSLADVLLPALAAQILFYIVAFSVSSFDPMYAVDGAFRRIALTLFPMLALVLGARVPLRAQSRQASAGFAEG
jgi:Dolichyl-phosphate-mannose-protein mannosyltransferase